jgi:hypothetical protein
MNSSFTEVKSITAAHLLKNDATFIYNGKSIELLLPQDVYVTEMVICDLAGRILYKYNAGNAGRTSHFIWNITMLNGMRLLTGRYVVQI